MYGVAKLTGERPIAGATPDSILALHEAGYREVISRLGAGRVLDAGCGEGAGSIGISGPGRTVVGFDYNHDAAAATAARGITVFCSEATTLALRSASFDWACSSHLIEHFDTPGRHAAELARVLRPSGTVLIATPNAPHDFENPFHLSKFTPHGLASLLSEHFEDVCVGGLKPSARAEADFEERRRKAVRLLRVADPLDLRHRLPRSWWTAIYSRGLRVAYRVMSPGDSGGLSGITAADFSFTDAPDDSAVVLIAIASRPRAVSHHGGAAQARGSKSPPRALRARAR